MPAVDEKTSTYDVSPSPDFGSGIGHRSTACTSRELFCSLFLDAEEHVHYLEPAFRFAVAALGRATPPQLGPAALAARIDELIARARAELTCTPRAASSASLAQRLVLEFAPSGLTDGAWLRGSVLSNAVETELGMLLLKQLMLRFGDPGSREAYVQRYAALMASVGLPKASIARAEVGTGPIAPASYEHALLGLTLGHFPTSLGAETLGFNLWMAAVGPCPLLEQLGGVLSVQGACFRYFDARDAATLLALARSAVERALRDVPGARTEARILRGFSAAQASYLRWERAMLRRHAELPQPEAQRANGSARAAADLDCEGEYGPPQDPASLEEFSFRHYSERSYTDLYYYFANADCHPAIHPFAKAFVDQVLGQLSHALDHDERLNSTEPPAYSERCIAELVAAQHEKNVRSRESVAELPPSAGTAEASANPNITQVFDGAWLQGFADVGRADFEEYGWLFRIYASEHGDGDWAWNHCQIFRRAFAELGPDVMLPKTDRRLYGLFEIGVASLATLAVSLHTRHFMPEILGINLGIEATGVGGSYMDQWKNAEQTGSKWRALAWRLHNSIDNYADGHTKWSLYAVQAFLRRVKQGSPTELETQWRRIWRLWRCQDILTHGSESERAALAEYLDATNLAPT